MSLDLIESVVSAWRQRDARGRVQTAPAWHDLEPDERAEAFAETQRMRTMEAALDPDGCSSTAHAVLARIRGE